MKENSTAELEPLLPPSKIPDIAKEEPRKCWACWSEEEDQKSDPMIRACRGCKGELRHIHQKCIDQFIRTHLNSRFINGLEEDFIPFVSEKILFGLRETHLKKIFGEREVVAGAFDDFILDKLDRRLPNGKILPALTFLGAECARCTYRYDIVPVSVHPLRVLSHDKLLRTLMALMVVSMTVLWVACGTILIQAQRHWHENMSDEERSSFLIKSWFVSQPVDIRTWTWTLLSFFTLISTLTFGFVMQYCRGYYELSVVAKD